MLIYANKEEYEKWLEDNGKEDCTLSKLEYSSLSNKNAKKVLEKIRKGEVNIENVIFKESDGLEEAKMFKEIINLFNKMFDNAFDLDDFNKLSDNGLKRVMDGVMTENFEEIICALLETMSKASKALVLASMLHDELKEYVK